MDRAIDIVVLVDHCLVVMSGTAVGLLLFFAECWVAFVKAWCGSCGRGCDSMAG